MGWRPYFQQGKRYAARFENAATIIGGLRVPPTAGNFMILNAIRKSNGCAVAVNKTRIREWMVLAASKEGLLVGPETATCVGAAELMAKFSWIEPHERVIIYNCGASQKYPDVLRRMLPRIHIHEPLDWDRIAADR